VSKLPNQLDISSNSFPEGQDDPVETLNVFLPEQDNGQLITTTGRPRHQIAIAGEQVRRNYYYRFLLSCSKDLGYSSYQWVSLKSPTAGSVVIVFFEISIRIAVTCMSFLAPSYLGLYPSL